MNDAPRKWHGSDTGKIRVTVERFVAGEYESFGVIGVSVEGCHKTLASWMKDRDLERAA